MNPLRLRPILAALLLGISATAADDPRAEATSFSQEAVGLYQKGRYAEGEVLMKRALMLQERALAPDSLDMRDTLAGLALFHDVQGRYAEAEPLLKQALAISKKALGPYDLNLAWPLDNLATLYLHQGRYAEPEPLLKHARTLVEWGLGPDHPDLTAILNRLAELHRAQGHYADAAALFERALEIREKALGLDNPDVADSMENLANFYRGRGRGAEAESLYKRALAIREVKLGPEHPDVAESVADLAILCEKEGHYSEAESLYKRALAIREKAFGPWHPAVAIGLEDLASLYAVEGRYAEAEPLYERDVAVREQALGLNHPDVATALDNLAVLYGDQGRYTEAVQLMQRALAIWEQVLGPNHPRVAAALNSLGVLYYFQHDYAEAESLHKRALAIWEEALGMTRFPRGCDMILYDSNDIGRIPANSLSGSLRSFGKLIAIAAFAGLGLGPTAAQAQERYGDAAIAENPVTQAELCPMYFYGRGVAQDYLKAVRWCTAAAEEGNAFAQAELGWMYANGKGVEQDDGKALKFYEAAAAAGDAGAQRGLGVLYQNGTGVEQDDKKALELYRKSAAQGNAVAKADICWMYENGRGVPRDYSEAVGWCTAAAEQGNAFAQAELGSMYANGKGVGQDYGKALKLYEAAAAAGNAFAQRELGWMYTNGKGVEQDDNKALELHRKSAAQGNAVAKADICWMYENGRGVPRDYSEAVGWCTAAAEQGNAFAMRELGSIAEARNHNVSVEERSRLVLQAYVWYRMAVDAGDEGALLRLANLTYTETLVAVDLNNIINADAFLADHRDILSPYITTRTSIDTFIETEIWLNKAIERGSVEALLFLAKLHLERDGLISSIRNCTVGGMFGKDKCFVGSAATAAELYERAIEKGSNAARIGLAALYEFGHGVERNRSKATALYRRALGTVFDAPARLGLLRDEFEGLWLREQARWRDTLVAEHLEIVPNGREQDITIEIVGEFVPITISDLQGRRMFSDNLSKGQQYRLPANRDDLIIWSRFGNFSNIRISVGKRLVDLPDGLGDSGIRIDRAALASGKSGITTVQGPFSSGNWLAGDSRITVEAIANSDIHVSGEDDLIGFGGGQEFQAGSQLLGSQLLVPNIPGLTLELRPSYDHPDQAGRVAVLVDHRHQIELTAAPGCLTTLRLAPEELLSADNPEAAVAACEGAELGGGPPPETHPILQISNSAGEPLAETRKLPDESIPLVPSGRLHINTGIGLLHLTLGGRWDEALRAGKVALQWSLREHGPNSFETIRRELQLCDFELHLGKNKDARERADRIFKRLKVIGNASPELQSEVYQRLADIFIAVSRSAEAKPFLMQQLALTEHENIRLQRPRFYGVGLVLPRLASIAEAAGDLDRAIVYRLAGLGFDEIQYPERSDNFVHEIAPPLLIDLMNLLRRSGRTDDFAKLLPFTYQQAKRDVARDEPEPLRFPLDLTVFERTFGPVDRSMNIAGALANLGQVYAWMDRHHEALPLFDQYLRTSQNVYGKTSLAASAALARLATEYRLDGASDQSLRLSREALSAAVQRAASRNEMGGIATTGFALLETLYGRAGAQTDPAEAGQLAIEAFDAAQHLQNSAAGRAVQASEARWAVTDPGLRDLVRQRQDLEERLRRLDSSLVAAVSSNAPVGGLSEDEIRAEIARAEAELTRLNQSNSDAFREIDRLWRPRIASYEAVRDLLNENEALLSFAIGDEASFIFAATKTELRWARVSLGSYGLERMVEILRCGLDYDAWYDDGKAQRCAELTGADMRESLLPFRIDVAHSLYSSLLGPFEEFIRDKHLLVVPSGALTSLPPQVLVARPGPRAVPESPSEYRDVSWLARMHPITILPSVDSLISSRTTMARSLAAKPYIGLGDPLLAGNSNCPPITATTDCHAPANDTPLPVADLRRGTSIMPLRAYAPRTPAGSQAVSRLCPLPDTAQELSCVAFSISADGSPILLGQNLTKAAIESADLGSYRIIHFATHALVADQLAGVIEPSLVLTPPESATAEDDGLLAASEIAKLRLNADLVILSACNTAAGDKMGAEALSGLARAFFYAGTRSLLVSHWSVPSQTTVKLMTGTFAELANDASIGPAEALRRAEMAMLDPKNPPEFAHPTLWAPFVVVGEGGEGR
jgi:TPR repeat protein/CHAT domain-containing protein/tetratricopeptide (TPR) repeat protein